MKRFFLPILTLLLAFACTPDNGGNMGNDGNGSGEYVPTGKITVKGTVYGGDGPLSGVVVSDGLLCVKTNNNGYYEIDSDLNSTKFIMVSIPSGYTAPKDAKGLPIFYQRVTDADRTAGLCIAKFNFVKITGSDPNRYTMIIGADPQPRSSSASLDKVAFHSLDMCKDLYRDMRETAAYITDREVYGMMLGDIVHENMSLYKNYIDDGLSTLGFPMFNILGNHDNDSKSKSDVDGRHSFEENLGPTYYSFNIGKQHYVVLDNLIMKLNSSGQLKDYDQGLTPEIWQWLQNDLRYVDRSTTLMVAAHSPMFMMNSMSDRSSAGGTKYGKDYATLLSRYAKVHAWAGHTHTTFNYNYPADNRLANIEVHTLSRSTGDLWTNEWSATGTPRGYTVVEVDGDDIKWYFKPTKYQTTKNQSSKLPAYAYRDWNYNDNGVAIMKVGGATLSESYQMKVYKPGEYHNTYKDMIADADKKNTNKYIYVDVFMWDDKWETPKFNGKTMSKVGYGDAYSLADYEIKSFYTFSPSDYAPEDNDLHTLFRYFVSDKSGTGTVTVKDRFGNEYSQSVSW